MQETYDSLDIKQLVPYANKGFSIPCNVQCHRRKEKDLNLRWQVECI